MTQTQRNGEQFVTFRIPSQAEAVAAGLDPEAWDPVLDITNDEHRLALALNAELPIRVPTWDELGCVRVSWTILRHPSGARTDTENYDVEIELRRDSCWELWIHSDDPQFECPTFDTEVEARWYVAGLLELAHAGVSA